MHVIDCDADSMDAKSIETSLASWHVRRMMMREDVICAELNLSKKVCWWISYRAKRVPPSM